jgi:hypothetical protein
LATRPRVSNPENSGKPTLTAAIQFQRRSSDGAMKYSGDVPK